MCISCVLVFIKDTDTTEYYTYWHTRSLHGALPIAAAAGLIRAPGDQHAERRGDHVEPLGDVFAEPRHLAATAGTQPALRLDDLFHARQMGGQIGRAQV